MCCRPIAFGHLDVRVAQDLRKLVRSPPFIMYQDEVMHTEVGSVHSQARPRQRGQWTAAARQPPIAFVTAGKVSNVRTRGSLFSSCKISLSFFVRNSVRGGSVPPGGHALIESMIACNSICLHLL